MQVKKICVICDDLCNICTIYAIFLIDDMWTTFYVWLEKVWVIETKQVLYVYLFYEGIELYNCMLG